MMSDVPPDDRPAGWIERVAHRCDGTLVIFYVLQNIECADGVEPPKRSNLGRRRNLHEFRVGNTALERGLAFVIAKPIISFSTAINA